MLKQVINFSDYYLSKGHLWHKMERGELQFPTKAFSSGIGRILTF